MKIKNLFVGLLCSLVLFGCQSQEVTDTRIPVEKMNDLFDVIIEYYNTNEEADTYNAEYHRDAYEGIYYLVFHAEKFSYNSLSQMIANEGQESLDRIVEKMETDINEDIVPVIRETGYLGQVKFIVNSSDGKEVFTYYLGFEEDKISKTEVLISVNNYFPQPEQNEIEVKEPQINIGDEEYINTKIADTAKTTVDDVLADLLIKEEYYVLGDVWIYTSYTHEDELVVNVIFNGNTPREDFYLLEGLAMHLIENVSPDTVRYILVEFSDGYSFLIDEVKQTADTCDDVLNYRAY